MSCHTKRLPRQYFMEILMNADGQTKMFGCLAHCMFGIYIDHADVRIAMNILPQSGQAVHLLPRGGQSALLFP